MSRLQAPHVAVVGAVLADGTTPQVRPAGASDRPYVRAAGTWIGLDASLPPGVAIEVAHGADLVGAVAGQLDDGADLVKLYLDGPDADTAPFSVEEVRAAVALAHQRG